MRTQSIDTNSKVEEIQVKLLHNMKSSLRFKKTLEMSSWILWLGKKAISKAHPGWDQKQKDLFFVETHYGNSLAQKLRNYLEKKHL
ncbi:MAG TPA: hypothetical protein VJB34_09645 [Bdellovibrionota bacterium]|nr:MAG: hypothetical protein A2Z91_07495 [Deltaproteobacteria bacterium GWA2_38_16]OGQ02751.1 MAG: hypothetical protein A3D19_00830 [Deltaproteobacteria bacterium RIFCSPHIGHO2_02_FULL_38_15]OGQ30736.1 MAG: hypothetical protein A3A72_09485 [Deltaproteobacteria bacterium RIFCSPLOWO2_01_FULL_38_9]OGQ60071.1 MAG: hypothetical protein A3G92_07410 [Deltaproteobacteria bacterium RIFCSPLOWO2_12_FULL_38_8]HBQ20612.1 hypothetical protein [Deltaproteobacteria bacterium]HLD75145.1 hypothetical protein [Bd